MNVTDDLREEATFHLSKYASMDMDNIHNKQKFCHDLYLLLMSWKQSGHFVMADKNSGMPYGTIFAGCVLNDNEIQMCYTI